MISTSIQKHCWGSELVPEIPAWLLRRTFNPAQQIGVTKSKKKQKGHQTECTSTKPHITAGVPYTTSAWYTYFSLQCV
jgi:hypothetical protein